LEMLQKMIIKNRKPNARRVFLMFNTTTAIFEQKKLKNMLSQLQGPLKTVHKNTSVDFAVAVQAAVVATQREHLNERFSHKNYPTFPTIYIKVSLTRPEHRLVTTNQFPLELYGITGRSREARSGTTDNAKTTDQIRSGQKISPSLSSISLSYSSTDDYFSIRKKSGKAPHNDEYVLLHLPHPLSITSVYQVSHQLQSKQ